MRILLLKSFHPFIFITCPNVQVGNSFSALTLCQKFDNAQKTGLLGTH